MRSRCTCTPWSSSRRSVPCPTTCTWWPAATRPRARWAIDVPTRDLKAGVTWCFYTSEERYGYLSAQAAPHTNDGGLDAITFTFRVWEGPND